MPFILPLPKNGRTLSRYLSWMFLSRPVNDPPKNATSTKVFLIGIVFSFSCIQKAILLGGRLTFFPDILF